MTMTPAEEQMIRDIYGEYLRGREIFNALPAPVPEYHRYRYTYTPGDNGDAALRREAEACEAEEETRLARFFREHEAALASAEPARTPEQQAFARKMREWREEGRVPSYIGPRAVR